MGTEISSCSAARVKLPLCTTWQNTFMLNKVSMFSLEEKLCYWIGYVFAMGK